MAGIRGVVGRIEWAYFVAAAVHGYSITKDPAGVWHLRATVVDADPFKMAQRPLRFVAPHANGLWTWPIETVDVVGGMLTARLKDPV